MLTDRLDEIRELEDEGVLHSESCPTPDYWHWLVKDLDRLPEKFKPDYEKYGEIRWYGGEDGE